ncbi:MAG TPA: hypothetical protein VJ596_05330 [Gemmatimonadaceae bacterium]|nr:hypothetical protein [Gemmatimonadaceae bacterium]
MYSTCLFCHRPLGSNESIEHFQIGRRLAYDAAKGRLWVVCRRCHRWNLTPMEERWEAIEECEEKFRSTRLRVSTDNIGLCRLPEGLEIIRIGNPLRPELAVWRYGERFGRRRRQALIKVSLGLGAIGAVVVGGAVAGAGLGGFGWLIYKTSQMVVAGNPEKLIARVPLDEDRTVNVKRKHLDGLRLHQSSIDDWSMMLRYSGGTTLLRGDAAIHAAGMVMPAVNRFGSTSSRVMEAVQLLERSGTPSRAFGDAARYVQTGGETKVRALPESFRLALEMAANEETERRAMEGELAHLEVAWRQAEEIAAIADNLILPAGFESLLRRYRKS